MQMLKYLIHAKDTCKRYITCKTNGRKGRY